MEPYPKRPRTQPLDEDTSVASHNYPYSSRQPLSSNLPTAQFASYREIPSAPQDPRLAAAFRRDSPPRYGPAAPLPPSRAPLSSSRAPGPAPGTRSDRSPRPAGGRPGAVYEHRIPIDLSLFPVEMNAIAQILGPRGKHQQRMKGEADAIVTLVGKGVRGHGNDEALCLVIKSKSGNQPLTKRQIATVQAIYDNILLHVRQFKTTDNMNTQQIAVPNTGPPETYVECLWFLHQLLIVPRQFDLEVSEIPVAYREHYGYECPLEKWLHVSGSSAAALQRALEKIPHIVDSYRTQSGELPEGSGGGIWRVRAANAPDILFATFRELDEVYRVKLAELASKGENEKIKTYGVVLQAIYRLLLERCVDMNGSISLDDLVFEYKQIYKQELDVYEAFQETSLLKFIQRFPSLFSVFYDGNQWRAAPVMAAAAAVEPTVERAVHQYLVMPRKPRIHVRLATIVPLPPKLGGPAAAPAAGVSAGGVGGSGGGGSSAVSSLVALLQSVQKTGGSSAANSAFSVVGAPRQAQVSDVTTVPPIAGPSVTAQIQELLKKKKEQSSSSSSSTGLGGLLNALKDTSKRTNPN